MAISASDLGDLITTTQKELGELRYTDLSTDVQFYTALSRLFQESQVSYEAGPSIQWNLMTSNSGAAKQTGLFAVDNLNVADVMATADIGWKHTTVNYAIERREIAMNRDPRKIVDLVKVRRNDAMISLTDHLEGQFWGKPANDASLDMNGVEYWISDASGMTTDGLSDGEFGFKGGLPVGFTTVASLDPTTVPRWQNGLGQYSAADLNDGGIANLIANPTNTSGIPNAVGVLQVMKEAYVKCDFKPIEAAPYPSYNGTPDKWGIYTSYDVMSALEVIQARLNDKVIARDVAQDANGGINFRGVPITYVPKLDSKTGNPIYMLQWGAFRSVLLSGEYMKETGPDTAPSQHTVFTTHVDCTMNMQCVDRRRNALLCTGAVA
tara:strand:- start:3836 stop:4975 length:1140 start_codon:yes stop_codon:yes gene_type:complete